MSTETLFRVDQVGTKITLIIKEPDPNDTSIDIVVDLSSKDAIGIEFRRPNKTTFKYIDKAGDPNLVPTPSTLVVVGSATLGTIKFTDNIGIWNVKGRWAYRGIYREVVGSITEDYPGSWIEREVGI